MDSEYKRFLENRRHQEQMAHHIQTPTPSTPTIITTVAVPVLQAIAIGLALALLGGGLPALFGAPLLLAAKLAAAGLVVGTAGATLAFVFQERSIHITPAKLAWERLHLASPSEPPPEPDDAEPWRVIRPYVAKAAPMITASATTLNQDVAAIEPSARPEVKALHQFVCDCWQGGTGNLSRDACRKHGYTRAAWERYIGGKRGKSGESARGILDRAGVVEKAATGWQWRTGCTLADVFSVQAELAAYADARAKMGIGRRDRTDRTGQDAPGTPSELSQARKG